MEYNKYKLIQIRAVGIDLSNLTHTIVKSLNHFNANILDLRQTDIYNSTSLGVLCSLHNDNILPFVTELKQKCASLGAISHFKEVPLEEYLQWVNQQGKDKYVLTLLGKKITAKHTAAVVNLIIQQNLKIDAIQKLTDRTPLEQSKANIRDCIELSLSGILQKPEELQNNLVELSQRLTFDFSLQKENMYRHMRRLICFDMDSTLIQTEVIDELAKKAGVGKQVKEITESAMRGEIDFKQSFKKRVSLLKGLDEDIMIEIAQQLPITDGVDRLMYVLKKYGYKIAILSGGFTCFANYLKRKYNIDYVFANQLEIANGKLTGNYIGEIIDGQRKVELLHEIAKKENIDIEQTIAVGDGANDLPMLNASGLGIGFHAKPIVKKQVKQCINTVGLDGILYFLGFKDSYLEEYGKL